MKIKFNRLKFILFFILLFTISAKADEIDDYVREQMAERHIPGAAITVIKNGKNIKAEGYGLASVEFSVPATKEPIFEIGSI